jgi:SAM-dependent methyltransferase
MTSVRLQCALTIAMMACAPAAQQPCPEIPPPVLASTPVPGSQQQPPDEALIKARSHDLFDAIDRADAATFQSMVGPSYGRFFAGRFYDTAFTVQGLQSRAAAHEPVRSRSWSDERVVAGPDAALFIGEAVEHVPASGDHPAADIDGYNTLVWTRSADGGWKAAAMTWQPAGVDAERQLWDATYRAPIGFNAKPNQLLVDSVKGRKPGTALDIAMGQGRNAVYLASQGWKVTGVDISDEGIRVAKDNAAKQKLKLDTVEQDITKYDLGENKWDLVTLIYAGDDATLIERIKPAVKKGGLVVVEYFSKDATAGTGIGGFESGALAHAFAGWKITKDEVTEDVADWGLRKMKLQRFVAEKP